MKAILELVYLTAKDSTTSTQSQVKSAFLAMWCGATPEDVARAWARGIHERA